MDVHDSVLYRDLTCDSRDSMYRAMTYIGRCGGPSIIGHPDDLANLLASRGLMVEWLLKQQDKDKIVEEYVNYHKRWSPVFLD